MTRIRLAAIGTLLLAAALLTTGSSTAPGQVFADSTGSGAGLRGATTIDIVDVGLSELHNLTGHSARVLRVSMASASPAVRLLSVAAYPAPPGVGILTGDLARLCRTAYPSSPVADAVTAAHSDSRWNLVLAFRFSRPGQYHLGPVRIFYATNGQNGWQYEHLNVIVFVKAPHPGIKPRFDGCP